MQVKILTLPGTDETYAREIYEALSKEKIRCELDDRNEKIGYKVRQARQEDRVPYMIIVGKNEIENKVISVRKRETDETISTTLDEFIANVKKEIEERI